MMLTVHSLCVQKKSCKENTYESPVKLFQTEMPGSHNAIRLPSCWACHFFNLQTLFVLHFYYRLHLSFALGFLPFMASWSYLPFQSSPLFSPAKSWLEFNNAHLAIRTSAAHSVSVLWIKFWSFWKGCGKSFCCLMWHFIAVSSPSTALMLGNVLSPDNWHLITSDRY